MLLAWLCVVCVGAAAEWLQISQQHFRKPLRLGTENPARDAFHVSATTPTRTVSLHREAPTRETYFNHSISEHDWNPNLRLNRPGNPANAWTEPPTPDGTRDVRVTIEQDAENMYEEKDRVAESERLKDETVSGKVERVSNIGSVQRVQLANTPVKSPTVKVNHKSNAGKHDDWHRTSNDKYFTEVEADIFKEPHQDKDIAKHVKHTLGNIDEPLSTSNRSVISKEKFKTSDSESQIHSFIHQPDNREVGFLSKGDSRFNQNIVLESGEKPLSNAEDAADTEKIKRPVKIQEINNIYDKNVGVSIDTVTKHTTLIDTVKKINKFAHKVSQKSDLESTNSQIIHKDKEEKDTNSENGENTSSSNEIKVDTMENILKFLKVVTETISKNTRRGANGKIMYLNELKHTLLNNIKERIDLLFPDDGEDASVSGGRRVSRATRVTRAQARGHVQVPSSESALMTISFLTFAVFLIKLVLQVIQTYKHKTMVMAPLMVATAGRGLRRARAAD